MIYPENRKNLTKSWFVAKLVSALFNDVSDSLMLRIRSADELFDIFTSVNGGMSRGLAVRYDLIEDILFLHI